MLLDGELRPGDGSRRIGGCIFPGRQGGAFLAVLANQAVYPIAGKAHDADHQHQSGQRAQNHQTAAAAGRCGWLSDGFVILKLPAILPGGVCISLRSAAISQPVSRRTRFVGLPAWGTIGILPVGAAGFFAPFVSRCRVPLRGIGVLLHAFIAFIGHMDSSFAPQSRRFLTNL